MKGGWALQLQNAWARGSQQRALLTVEAGGVERHLEVARDVVLFYYDIALVLDVVAVPFV